MEPDPVLVSNTKGWLLLAKEDLKNAEHDLVAPRPFVRDALFHCQQSVEKAMKALLTWHDSAFRDAPWEPSMQEAQESLQIARSFLDDILKRLPSPMASFEYRDPSRSVG